MIYNSTLMLSFLSFFSAVFTLECSKGFFLYSNKCLQAVSDRKSWNEARMNCKKLGGRLAVIRTQVDQNAVNDVDFDYCGSGDSNNIWIGGLRKDKDILWLIIGPYTSFNFTNWNDGKPDGDDTRILCMQVSRNKKWLDSECYVESCSLCEADPIV